MWYHFKANLLLYETQSSPNPARSIHSPRLDTCLYGDINNHYALNLGHCFSVGWDMVCRLVFSYTLDNFFGSFFPIRS